MKWRFAKSLIGGRRDGEDLYRWMIYERAKDRILAGEPTDGWKMKVDDWVESFEILLDSIYDNGLLAQHAIPIDKNHQLLNGSHRLAAALAWQIKDVYIFDVPKLAWAPPWGMQWFEDHGIDQETKMQLHQDWNEVIGL